jgi:hypothetical protein
MLSAYMSRHCVLPIKTQRKPPRNWGLFCSDNKSIKASNH